MNPKIREILKEIKAGVQKTIWFDLDGTICRTTDKDYEHAEPIQKMIDLVNELHKKGHTIVVATSRGTSREIDMREQINTQLKNWGVNYHRLLIIRRDFFVDDSTLRPDEFMDLIEVEE